MLCAKAKTGAKPQEMLRVLQIETKRSGLKTL
jgi:hypothetical protein